MELKAAYLIEPYHNGTARGRSIESPSLKM